jgi:hypothetical protein
LKELLPKNQVQDINVFRPRDEENMQLRLETLKICHGQVRERRMRERNDRHERRLKRKARRAKRIAQYDGPQCAFRDHCSDRLSITPSVSDSSAPDTGSSSSISATLSPASTVLEFVDPKLTVYSAPQTEFRSCKNQDERDAHTNPAQVTDLTGSNDQPISHSTETVYELENTEVMRFETAQFSKSLPQTPVTNELVTLRDGSTKTFGTTQGTEVTKILNASHGLPTINMEEKGQSSPEKEPKALQRLSEQMTRAIVKIRTRGSVAKSGILSRVEHTAIVAGFSGAASTTSSLMSWASHISSRLSTRSSLYSGRRVPELDIESQASAPAWLTELSAALPAAEEEVRIELIGGPTALTYSSLSPNARPCCGGFAENCTDCGRKSIHYELRCSSWVWRDSLLPDYYGNSHLHWAAHSASSSLLFEYSSSGSVDHLTDAKYLAELKNTLGETALHLLQCNSSTEIRYYYAVINYIAERSAGKGARDYFHRRDCHGRAILHRFLSRLPDNLCRSGKFQSLFLQLLTITTISIDTADNQGETISDLLARRTSQLHLKPVAPRRRVIYREYTYINPLHIPSIIDEWLAGGLDINWIDENGDTILIALIKYQITEDLHYVKWLIDAGADFSIKDRKGNTALSAAVCTGCLSITLMLLKEGANVQNRNYTGVGILLQAAEQTRLAKQSQNYGLNTAILNCMNLLIDYGAIIHPTDMDEWMTPEGRAKRADVSRMTRNKPAPSTPLQTNVESTIAISSLAPGAQKHKPRNPGPTNPGLETCYELEA